MSLQVNERNDDIIEAHIDKLIFYYGTSDAWCPTSYYEDLKRRYGDEERSHIELCKRGFQHAFVLRQSTEVANLVIGWTADLIAAL